MIQKRRKLSRIGVRRLRTTIVSPIQRVDFARDQCSRWVSSRRLSRAEFCLISSVYGERAWSLCPSIPPGIRDIWPALGCTLARAEGWCLLITINQGINLSGASYFGRWQSRAQGRCCVSLVSLRKSTPSWWVTSSSRDKFSLKVNKDASTVTNAEFITRGTAMPC